ncbi:MAG TPA: hypothetical protein PKD78_12010 [Saprospiraceae bacterium]|nr:hypothetical protein [Saprospiraceae bacterium]
MKNIILIPALLLAFVSGFSTNATAQDSDSADFAQFLAQFPQASLPYTFTADELKAQVESNTATKTKRLGWQYYQFLPELERSAEYSNMPVYPEPVAAFETQDYYAVLYNIARGTGKGAKTYTLSLFDRAGNHIATNFVAGADTKTLTTSTINTELKADVQEYKVIWTLDLLENGREGNSIKALETKAQQVIDLTLPGNPDLIEWSVKTSNTDTSSTIATK